LSSRGSFRNPNELDSIRIASFPLRDRNKRRFMNLQNFTTDLYSWLSTNGLKIVLIMIISWIGLKVLHTFMRKVLRKAMIATAQESHRGAVEKRVKTLDAVFFSAVKVVVWLIVGMIILSEFNIEIGPLLAAAGVAGLAFGFGGQYLIRDLISGLFIILEDQYRKGDVIKIAGITGAVENITLRKTTLRDLDGIEHHIPNGEVTTTSNHTKLWSRAHMNIGISYDSNLEKAIEILNRIGKEMAEEEPWRAHIVKPIQSLGVDNFSDSSVDIKVIGETAPASQWDVLREYRKRVKLAFDQDGIEIPYPHRTIVQKKSNHYKSTDIRNPK